MSPRRRRAGRPLTREDLPALHEFARGYLHQDVAVEHGDAAGAARAFVADASEEERRALVVDLRRVRDVTRGWTAARRARLFAQELGAAWVPETDADIAALVDAVETASGV
jgi:hypothetical protein